MFDTYFLVEDLLLCREVYMKSETCIGKVTGKPLSEYYGEEDAQEAAEYSRDTYDNDLMPYKCSDCACWHLSPKGRQTPSHKCQDCTSGNGIPKDTYKTKKVAIIRSNILFDEQGIDLKVYKCKYGDGWHLTKRH